MGENFELIPIYIMGDIFPRKLQHLSFIDIAEIPDAGHLTIIIFQMKYCVSVFLIPEHNVSHISCNCLQLSSSPTIFSPCSLCPQKNRDVLYNSHP